MYMSDRAMANFWLMTYVLMVGIFLAAVASINGTIQSQGGFFAKYAIIFPFVLPSPILIGVIALFFRNRPVFGYTEDDTRRNIKQWYRDAKKWMDEHPEDVEMKDL